jgi:hypothetical protein
MTGLPLLARSTIETSSWRIWPFCRYFAGRSQLRETPSGSKRSSFEAQIPRGNVRCPFAGTLRDGSDGTRTRDLRRDRPAIRDGSAMQSDANGRTLLRSRPQPRSESAAAGRPAASVLQASGFLGDATVFRPNAAAAAETRCSAHFDGIRRNACTRSRRLITRRSQVQNLPPLYTKRPAAAGLSFPAPFRSARPVTIRRKLLGPHIRTRRPFRRWR